MKPRLCSRRLYTYVCSNGSFRTGHFEWITWLLSGFFRQVHVPFSSLFHATCFHVSPLGVIMDSKRWTFYFSSHATLRWYSLCPGHYPQIRERWTCTTWNTSLPRLPFCCCIRIWLKQPITYIFNLLKNEEKFWAFQLRQSVFLQICVFIVYPPGKVWLLTDLSPKLGHRSYEETSLFWAGIPSTAFHSVSPSLSFTHLKNWERT